MKKQYAFYIDAERCIGCFTCAMACKNQYHQPETVIWRQVYPIKEEIYPHRERAFYSLQPLRKSHLSECLSGGGLLQKRGGRHRGP